MSNTTTPVEVIEILKGVRDSYQHTNLDCYRLFDKLIENLSK